MQTLLLDCDTRLIEYTKEAIERETLTHANISH